VTARPQRNFADTIRRIAAMDDTAVLICGRGALARAWLQRPCMGLAPGRRTSSRPINCATLPEPLLDLELFGYVKGAFPAATAAKAGILESASHGTIVFDEIGWMPRNLQRKLHTAITSKGLRRIGGNENIPIDVRVIATAITPAAKLVEQGNVIEEIYSMFRSGVIEVKDLQGRKEDIIPLGETHPGSKKVAKTDSTRSVLMPNKF